MSLTNDQITAKNFKEFYEAIRPYLNGSFPTAIANKFDKANMYSMDEQIVGRWIDGKPIYQKTISCGTGPNNNLKEVSHEISDIDTIVKTDGLDTHADSDKTGGSLPWVDRTSFLCGIWADKNKIYLRSTYDASGSSYYCTLQYTKTTDTAMDIGSDTDYSTTEKIVGTWIDGKPVYQKTFTGTTPSSAATSTDIFSISDLNIDKLISLNGSVTEQGGTYRYPINHYIEDGDYTACWLRPTTCAMKTHKTNGTFYVTLQYTKTTD